MREKKGNEIALVQSLPYLGLWMMQGEIQQVGYSGWQERFQKVMIILYCFVFSEIENAVEKSSFKVFLLDSITLWPSMKYVSVVEFRWLLACCSHVICMHRTRKKHALLIVNQNYFQILQGQGVQQCFSLLPSATIVPCRKRH